MVVSQSSHPSYKETTIFNFSHIFKVKTGTAKTGKDCQVEQEANTEIQSIFNVVQHPQQTIKSSNVDQQKVIITQF